MSLASELLELLYQENIILTIIIEKQDSILLETFNNSPITEQKDRIKGTNLMLRYDPENTNTLTNAHYTVLLKNKEIYSVNKLSGQAHHRRNRGVKVHNKVAKFLRQKGVNLPDDNILENYTLDSNKFYSFLKFEL